MAIIKDLNKRSQDWRGRIGKPLFRVLTAGGLTSNRLTFLRFLVGPVFLVWFPVYPRKMTLLLVIACALDWVDGGLARYQGKASDRGKFWDVLVDHLNYVFPILALLLTEYFSTPALAYQLLIAPVVFLLATIKESEKTKTDWIIHPYYSIVYFKPFAMLALVLLVVWGIDIIDLTVVSLNVAMTACALYFALILSLRWSDKPGLKL